MDISLIKIIGDEQKSIVKTDLPIEIVIAIPERLKSTSSNWMRNFAVIRVHNGKPILLEDKDTSKDTITIETDQFSIYALVYRDEMTNNDNAGNQEDSNEIRNHSSNSLGSNYRDSEQDFWNRVEDQIESADPGDTVKANAKGYDRMPWTVMEALCNADGVTLHISWNGGEDIIIPSEAALSEQSRIYYPLSYLEGIDFTVENEATVYDPSKDNPNTGGILEVTAPATADAITTPAGEPEITDPQRGLAESPELAEKGIEQAIPGVYEPENTVTAATDSTSPEANFPTIWIAIILMAAVAAGGGLWYWKRKQNG